MIARPQRTVMATPLPSGAVHCVIGPEPGQRGPWSCIAGNPGIGGDLAGPPPVHLAVAAWGA